MESFYKKFIILNILTLGIFQISNSELHASEFVNKGFICYDGKKYEKDVVGFFFQKESFVRFGIRDVELTKNIEDFKISTTIYGITFKNWVAKYKVTDSAIIMTTFNQKFPKTKFREYIDRFDGKRKNLPEKKILSEKCLLKQSNNEFQTELTKINNDRKLNYQKKLNKRKF